MVRLASVTCKIFFQTWPDAVSVLEKCRLHVHDPPFAPVRQVANMSTTGSGATDRRHGSQAGISRRGQGQRCESLMAISVCARVCICLCMRVCACVFVLSERARVFNVRYLTCKS